jgi:hypothetical protein
MALGRHFYHDSEGHAFKVNADGWGVSTGTLIFVDGYGNPSANLIRHIRTANDASMSSFNRAANYIAFPNVIINTNDTLEIKGKMGLDAASIHLGANKTGRMVLRSEVDSVIPTNLKVYDASLRISGIGNSEALVDAGSVIIERDLSIYRQGSTDAEDVNHYPLFAFAAPMKNMISGYFAGNWIRKLKTAPTNHEHVQYVYGNQSTNGIINRDQYLYDATESFENGKAYLVKAKPTGYNYGDLDYQTELEGANFGAFDKGMFVFDGNVYTIQGINSPSATEFKEQVFADEALFPTRSFNNEYLSNTINWVIGNSWTSAISVPSLVEQMNASGLIFEPNIYVWPSGSTTYQKFSLSGEPEEVGVLDELTSIPSQSLFMIRVLSSVPTQADKNQTGSLTLSKSQLQIHSGASHNALRSSNAFHDELLFRVTPEANDNIYDLTAVGLRAGAKEEADTEDMSKMYQQNSPIFMLYSPSVDGQKLSSNVVPPDTHYVRLSLHPGESGGRMKLSVSRTESIAQAWIEDIITGEVINLKETDSYHFTTSPQDTPDRFIVHFVLPTREESITNNFLQCYYSEGELVVKGLKPGDLHSRIAIVDMQGRILQLVGVSQTPEMRIPLRITDGIYIAKLEGNRNLTLKFRKGAFAL